MRTVIDISKWDRKDLFDHYDEETNPFAIINTPIDVTNVYNYCKSTGNSIYATMGYIITKTVNSIEGFRFRKENDEIVVYDKIHGNFTENIDNKIIGFFTIKNDDTYKDFIDEFNDKRDGLKIAKKSETSVTKYNEIWMSCVPWFEFNAAIPPFNKKNTIPQFIWDKFKKENNVVKTNLMIMVHHGFVDGYHIGKFINELQENINNFKGEE